MNYLLDTCVLVDFLRGKPCVCDALIAATSVKNGGELITYNISDFRFIPDVQLYQFNNAV